MLQIKTVNGFYWRQKSRSRVSLNSRAQQLDWLITKYSEFVKYVLTNFRLESQ